MSDTKAEQERKVLNKKLLKKSFQSEIKKKKLNIGRYLLGCAIIFAVLLAADAIMDAAAVQSHVLILIVRFLAVAVPIAFLGRWMLAED